MGKIVVSVPDEELLHSVRQRVDPATVELLLWDMREAASRSTIDIVVPPYLDAEPLLTRLSGVTTQLVQWQSIGYNAVGQYLPEGHRLANAATVHETATAELAVGLAIAAQRELPRFVRQQDSGQWRGGTTRALADRRVLLIGYGGVGKAIAQRLRAFEVDLTCVASTARLEELPGGDTVQVHGIAELSQLLPAAEIVILAVPLTAHTRGMLGAAQLALLPDDALLVNVARGAVVHTAELLAELRTGRIRAALDVVDPEPLPPQHELWQLPNVLLTPHTGGDADVMLPRITALVVRQIAALLAGEQPENIVTP